MRKPPVGPTPIRFLGYGLPRTQRDSESRTIEGDGFTIHDVPFCTDVSFPDFDGVVLFAGAYEQSSGPSSESAALADLDLREREFFTASQSDIPFVFLVPRLQVAGHDYGNVLDLFTRVSRKLGVFPQLLPQGNLHLRAPFPSFVSTCNVMARVMLRLLTM